MTNQTQSWITTKLLASYSIAIKDASSTRKTLLYAVRKLKEISNDAPDHACAKIAADLCDEAIDRLNN